MDKLQLLLPVLLLPLLGILDYFTGSNVNFIGFYLALVLLGSIRYGKTFAYLFAAFAFLEKTVINFYAPTLIKTAFLYSLELCSVAFTLYAGCFLCQKICKLISDLKRLSESDPLTGILNAAAFRRLANKEIEKSRRYKNSLSLVFLDLDNFKTVNDTLGHKAGDKLLKDIVRYVANELRSSDLFGRLGGDEFAILLIANCVDSLRTINRIRDAVKQVADELNASVSLSAGVVQLSEENDIEDLLHKADILMYEAKHSGKDSVVSQKSYNSVISNIQENSL